MDAVGYYERVDAAMGGHQATGSFFRLFMVPGMTHCGGGPGPNFFGGFGPSEPSSSEIKSNPEHDILSAVVQWVERGSAPDHIIGSHFNGDHIDRTRPICPYPKVARWNGIDTSDDAKNFTCGQR